MKALVSFIWKALFVSVLVAASGSILGCPADDCEDNQDCMQMNLNSCVTSSCISGSCVNSDVLDGTLCDQGGICSGGMCERPECDIAEACNDSDECTREDCEDGMCVYTPVNTPECTGDNLPTPGEDLNLFIDVYALLDTTPADIETDDQGRLFVGNNGDLDDPPTTAGPLPILRIEDGATSLTELPGGPGDPNLVVDPDFLAVDNGGADSIGCADGGVFIGGLDPTNGGTVTELDLDGGAVQSVTTDPTPDDQCIGNASSMLVRSDGTLLVANVPRDEDDTISSVCELTRASCPDGNIDVAVLIEGTSPNLLIGGLAEDPNGTLYLSQRENDGDGTVDRVYRFDPDEDDPLVPLTEGIVAGYGPSGIFEGLLVTEPDGILVSYQLTGDAIDLSTRQVIVRNFGGNYLAIRPAQSGNDPEVMYISQVQRNRIVRVSTEQLDPTPLSMTP
ncbi:MAG: hypothetical protein AAGF92_07165 [Myxococcota bacterium]